MQTPPVAEDCQHHPKLKRMFDSKTKQKQQQKVKLNQENLGKETMSQTW